MHFFIAHQNRTYTVKSGAIYNKINNNDKIKNHEWFCRGLRLRIALLQRQTLTETKNFTLKCLKWHYSTGQTMKTATVWIKDGAFGSSNVPAPGNIQLSRPNKMINKGIFAWPKKRTFSCRNKLNFNSIQCNFIHIIYGKVGIH